MRMFTHPKTIQKTSDTRLRGRRTSRALLAGFVCAAFLLTGCSQNRLTSQQTDTKTVTVITHDSFPSEAFEKAASEATGYEVKTVVSGDGTDLSNKLLLLSTDPVADVFFGVNNFFISRLAQNDVLEPYSSPNLAAVAKQYFYDDRGTATPVDRGNVCVNVDKEWFAAKQIPQPQSYEDLLKPEYRGLTVAIDPKQSSTGMAFLVGTVSHFGENGYGEYWKNLIANDAKIASGWGEAYNGNFTQGGGEGTYPIVVSYGSSPAWTLNEAKTETKTQALLNTCTTQVEYAGIVKGTKNLAGAKAVIDYMLSREFQDTVADEMYVYPIDNSAKVPEKWSKFAPLPQNLNNMSANIIGQKREEWLKTWEKQVGNR